jgi:hypothetical protein
MSKLQGEAFSPQKRTSSTSKILIYYLFLYSLVIFALMDPDPDSGTPLNPDPAYRINGSNMVYMRPVDNADAVKVVQGTGFRDPIESGSTTLVAVQD